MPSSVAITVAIPAFRKETALLQTLARITACNPLPSEILIHFDGGWRPESDLSSLSPVPIRPFYSTDHRGPGGGRDLLIRAASNELVASFDDDSWPEDPDYFARAAALMAAFPRAAVLSPSVSVPERPSQNPLPLVWEARSFDGSASITRRSAYLSLPGYVPLPHAYGMEEVDLAFQARTAGLQVLNSPWLRAHHNRAYQDNRHSVLPWIQNELLLAFLRYPLILQPISWLRALWHIRFHWHEFPARSLFLALTDALPLCASLASFKQRASVSQTWNHLRGPLDRWQFPSPPASADSSPPHPVLLKNKPAILYLQFTNPGAYPPLEHGSRILADRGWHVDFLGLKPRPQAPLHLPFHPLIRVFLRPAPKGRLFQKLGYLAFGLRALLHAWKSKPSWIYASDHLSTPAAALIHRLLQIPVIYHEHDSPLPSSLQGSAFARFTARLRTHLAQKAAAILLPNQGRLSAFLAQTKTSSPAFCVWNCPALSDVSPPKPSPSINEPLKVLYQGSIVPDRFPSSYLDALKKAGPQVHLRLVGYEGAGCPGYVQTLLDKAILLGVSDRFEYLGPIPDRSEMLKACSDCHAGLCLLNINAGDINMQHMVGASNKPFDYLSQGLALIIPDDPEWTNLYSTAACAVTSSQEDVETLSTTFRWLADHRDEVWKMGEAGRQKILSSWNYESQFSPVVTLIESPTS